MGVELNLNTGYRFNWVTSIFYIVYMFVEGTYSHHMTHQHC